MSRDVIATVDLALLRHNARVIQALVPASKIMGVVKSDACGHGVVPVSHALAPIVSGFGVAHLEEALALRRSGIDHDKTLLILEGAFCYEEFEQSWQQGCDMVLHTWEQLEYLQIFARRYPLAARSVAFSYKSTAPRTLWIKVNTGLNRLGFDCQDVLAVYQKIRACGIVDQIVIMTHFANADQVGDNRNFDQELRFRHVLNAVIAEKNSADKNNIEAFQDNGMLECKAQMVSLSNSGALLNYPEIFQDWVRPGIMLYGVSPTTDREAIKELDLQPVMTLTAKVIAIRDLQPGDQVGYGGCFTVQRPMRIAVAGIGYGDGYPWSESSQAMVYCNGAHCPVVGRISMDMLTFDISNVGVKIGDHVELWGANVALEAVARHNHTISYELLCRLTQRVRRVYINESVVS